MGEATHPKLPGSAGSKGVDYQLKLLQFYLLQGYHEDKDFILSTENKNAANFDDVVYERGKNIIVLQAKHLENKNQISFEQLFPQNLEDSNEESYFSVFEYIKGLFFPQYSKESKENGPFNLFKYIKGFQKISFKSDIQYAIICTNCKFSPKSINQSLCKKLKNNEKLEFLTERTSIFSIQNSKCYSFNQNQPVLVKHIFEKVPEISEDVIKLFLKKLLLVSIFDNDLNDQIQSLIKKINIIDEHISAEFIQRSIFDKTKRWFESTKGVYLTKINVIGYISQIKCSNYIKRKRTTLSVLLEKTSNIDGSAFNLVDNKLLFKIRNKETYDLHEFQLCQRLLDNLMSENRTNENDDEENKANKMLDKMLFVDPNAPLNIVKNIINSFEVPEYICLIVPIFDNIQKFSEIKSELDNAIKKNKSYKKIIIISDILDEEHKLDEFLQNFKVVESNIKFSDFSTNIQNKILLKEITFHGNKMPVQNIIENEVVKWDDIIDETTLLKLAIGKEELIVNNFIAEEIPLYVDRKFLEIDKQKFDKYFEYSNQQAGSIRHNSPEYLEQDFCTKIINKCNIFTAIFDSPGMGKSTILNRLSFLLREKPYWIIKINLNECTKIMYKLSKEKCESVSLDKLLDLLDHQKKTEFEKNLFNIPKNVILLVDALDEICPEYSDLILNSLISIACNENIKKIVLASRPHVLTKLEDKKIKCDMYALKHFSENESIAFLANFWCKNLNTQQYENKKVETFANKLYDTLKSNKGWYKVQSLIGIPLQIRMIGDIFTVECNNYLRNVESNIELPKEFNLNWLYEQFIDRQKEIYIDEKCNASGITATMRALDISFNKAINDYKREAIKLEFPTKTYRLFEILKSQGSCDEDDLLKMGILIKSNENFYFAHRTLSEYFATLHICELILKNNISKAFLRFLITESKFLKNNSFMYHMLVDRSIPEQILLCTFQKTDNLKNCLGQNLITLFIRKLGYEKLFKCLWLVDLERVHEMIENNLDIFNELENVNFKSRNNITPLHLACKYNSKEIVDILITKEHPVMVFDGYGRSPLHYAVHRNKKDILVLLLNKGLPVDIVDNFGLTPLHYAVQWTDDTTIIEFLLINKHSLEVEDNFGCTPLHYAVQSNRLKFINFLLSTWFTRGLSIEIRDNIGRTPLHYALQSGYYETVERLLYEGHSIEIRDNVGRTVLHYAVILNNKYDNIRNANILSKFIENGHPLHTTDYAGRTLLHYAAILKDNKTVEFLLEKGHAIDIIDIFGKTPSYYQNELYHRDTETGFLFNKIYYIDIPDVNGKTPLHYEVEFNQNDTVNLSINEGLPFYIGDVYGRTQLHFAAKFGKTDIIELLLNKGYLIDIRDGDGKTPLHYALNSAQDYTVEFLLEKGHPVKIDDKDGVTPLHIAAKCCKTEIIDLLLKKGHPIDSRDMVGKTPLHYALKSDKDDNANFLLKEGHPVDICDRNGETPLHIALIFGAAEIVDSLLNKGHTFNIGHIYGATPLHIAAKFGRIEIIKLFLKKGYSIDIRDWKERTPLHYAVESKRYDTVDFLLNKGHPVDISDYKGITVLHIAAGFDKTEIIQLLLNKVHSVEIGNNDGVTPLHIAVKCGNIEIVNLLLNKKHTIDIGNIDGLTPLEWAIIYDKIEIRDLLFEKGHYTDDLKTIIKKAHFKYLKSI